MHFGVRMRGLVRVKMMSFVKLVASWARHKILSDLREIRGHVFAKRPIFYSSCRSWPTCTCRAKNIHNCLS